MIGSSRWATAARRAMLAIVAVIACGISETADADQLFEIVGARTQVAPIGWLQFCATYVKECDTTPLSPRDVVLDGAAFADLVKIDKWVNHTVKPETDMDHYGKIQWWRYPDDGAGACHSFALLKRRMLMQAGWPRQALLMTIVHEDNGDGHAVLTVTTDRGDFILDNLTDEILPWSKTPYHYYKRQSQDDPNSWVWLGNLRSEPALAAIETK